MADKHRELPSWMGIKQGDCFTKKVTPRTKKHLAPRVTVYLINENELVQSAMLFGNSEDRNVTGFTEKVPKSEHLEDRRKEGLEQGPMDSLCARASESLDTTELETLPYGNDLGLQSGNQNCIGSILTEHPDIVPDGGGGDDDALKLVKEIFFK